MFAMYLKCAVIIQSIQADDFNPVEHKTGEELNTTETWASNKPPNLHLNHF